MTRALVRYKPRSRFNLGQVARHTAGALISSRGNPYALAARGAGYLARYAGNQMYKAITYKGYRGVRSAGSPAKKVIKKEPKSMEVANIGGTGSLDSYTYKIKCPTPKRYGKLPKQLTDYTQDFKGILTGSPGVQTVTSIASVNAISQIVTSIGEQYAYYQAYKSWYDMDPNFNITGSKGGYLVDTTAPGDRKYMLVSNQFNLELYNTAATAMVADVYVLQCKRQTTLGPETTWTNGLVAESLGQHVAVQTSSSASAGANQYAPNAAGFGVGYPSTLTVGQRPSTVKLFRQYWKVAAVRSCKLSGGSSEIINFDIKHPQLIKQDTVQEQSSENAVFRIGSYVMMIVQRGQLAIDITGSPHYPTYAATSLSYICNTRTKFGSRTDAIERPTVKVSTARATVSTSTANQQILSSVVLPTAYSTTIAA